MANWDDPWIKFCRWQNIGEWQVAAQDKSPPAAAGWPKISVVGLKLVMQVWLWKHSGSSRADPHVKEFT